MAQVFIGIGSSISRRENIRVALSALQSAFGHLVCSNVYESEPVGFQGNNFYNMVVSFNSLLAPTDIIIELKAIEKRQGRPIKSIKFSPRTLDLDLLLHDQLVDISIDLPRAEILTNAFVLQPLAEISGMLKHPILNVSYRQLWHDFSNTEQKLWKVKSIQH